MFHGKRILVAVTASIAAYKAAFLVRLLKKEGAEVKVVLTPSALDFVTPLTLATLSGNPVHSEFTEDADSGEWTNHVALGLWADLMIVAPATANTMAKMVSGEADNFLLAVYLSAKCPVMIAPAMDLDMYKHPSTRKNLETLTEYGNIIVPAESGELASGLSGEGRMAEPENIVEAIRRQFFPPGPLSGKKILITAGPTYEPLDPVRFLGNRSTGQMGYRLAEEASRLGAQVTLVSGPTHETCSASGVTIIPVETAQEMFEACQTVFERVDVAILSAAVADYRPKIYSKSKIKKSDTDLSIPLERTTDILARLGELKTGQKLIGFALETDNELENARAKLLKKNLDLIVLNSLKDEGAGFGGDTNKITIIDKDNNIAKFELKSKARVAADILQKIADLYE